MAVYLIEIFLILLVSAGFHPESNEKGKRRFLVLTFALLTVVSGIRGYSVGADTMVYVNWFRRIDYIPVNNGMFGPGFTLYLKLLHLVSSDPTFLLFVSSTICIGSAWLFIYRYSKKPTISVLLYLMMGSYFSQMNTMRQALAMSITILAFIILLSEGNRVRRPKCRMAVSALLIFVATSFHTVAVVTFIPWVLLVRQGRNEGESKLTIGYAQFQTFLLSIIAFAAYSVIMRITSSIFPEYVHYFYSEWSDSNYFASLLKTMIYIVFLTVGGIILRGRKLTNAQRFSAIMLGLSVVFSVLSMRMEIWERVAGIFVIYIYLIWVPEFLTEVRLPSNRRIIEGAIFVFALAYMLVVLVFRPEWSRVVPYVVRQ